MSARERERERKRMHCIKQMSIYSCIYVRSKENERAPERVYAKEREREELFKQEGYSIYILWCCIDF
jgi:hypothetical protein